MNYRHGYHAGNFADVFKHLVLINLIQILKSKDKPFCYLETHAGSGLYHLGSHFSSKTGEASNGISKLMNASSKELPEIIKTYLEIVKNSHYPAYYPGSPIIANSLLREEDRLVLMELHPEEFRLLKDNFKGDKRIALHHQDGYLGLKAFLPPKERRGLIFIDPSFEKEEEWDQLIHGLEMGMKKFGTGIYVIWYPIKDLKRVQKFFRSVKNLNLPNLLNTELNIYPKDAPLNLIGSGMLVVNSPWSFSNEVRGWLPSVWRQLSVNGAGGYQISSV